ncbi:MAG: hypothetical protein A3F10_01020 [Coxiella sp. RIFCSPHIGHO2_12_FULL_42_15]|nr:MAG: hypothetical protein A3F10_01020 [Coxiella sp. RIFCSPHIGHO2_12_FULL_42_15]
MVKQFIKKLSTNLSFVFICTLSIVFVTPTFSASGVEIQKWQTSQGVPVYFVERPEIPMMDIAVVFSAGSARDDKNWGLASFTSTMLDEGTTTKSSIDIAREFDQVGAQMSAGADRDMTMVSLRSLTDSVYFTPAFHLFLDVLTNPCFPSSSFVRVQNQTLDVIRQNRQDPSNVAQETFFKNLYSDQPYGHPILGTEETVKAIPLAALKEFYKKYYVRGNALVVLVGAFNSKQAHDVGEKIASSLHAGKAAPLLPMAQQQEKGKNIFVTMPVTQNTVMMGNVAISRNDPNYFNLLVANHVLGGLPMTSLLFNEVRNKEGLAYAVYSGFAPLQAKGPFVVMLQTRATKTAQAIHIARTTVKKYLNRGPTREELQDAKLNLVGGFPLKVASNHGVLTNVINIAFYQLPLNYLQTYTTNVSKVTARSAKKAFDHVVQLSRFNTIEVGAQQGHG